MKKFVPGFALIVLPLIAHSQGLNSHWLIGYNTGVNEKGRFYFDNTTYSYTVETRTMQFWGTQATISDEQGNFLMSSNGVWIANANNDTMMNGGGLNPGYYVNSWPNGLVITSGNMFLPDPSDTNKYVLFHQTRLDQNSSLHGIYKSVVDVTLDGGLGAVIDKNDTLIIDQLTWGLTACKHANGRDWWVIAQKDSSDSLYVILYTANGIMSINTISLGYTPFAPGNVSQITFSPDGTKFVQNNYDNPFDKNSFIIVSDFDRCTGTFNNTQTLPLYVGSYVWGLSFSPNSNFIYASNGIHLLQVNATSLSVDTVAIYDGFVSGSPPNCCATTFRQMYLAANGKIYLTSGSSVQHIHEMNYPDSAGLACDVQQHAINLGVWNLRSVPNHPNYYLGPVLGSTCDTLGLGISENNHDFKFSISPNPNNGHFRISYLLPQNHKGKLEVFDVNGRRVYEMVLPQWSTMQYVSLPNVVSSGVYNLTISSGVQRTNKKLALIDDQIKKL